MEKLTVDLTYGQALFDAAKDRGKTEEIGEEYKAVSRVFADNPGLGQLLSLPTVSESDKKAIVAKVFGGRISEELLAFICILIDKRRIRSWEGIGREYEKLVRESEGFTEGVLYSVVPTGKERLKVFEERAAELTGKRVALENRIDPALVGGVRIYVDGKLIDASLKGRLETMKQRIRQ